VISAYKGWLRDTLARLAGQAGIDHADDLADALLMLIDGANARVVTTGDRAAMHRAKTVAARLIGVPER
jgi:hypothetical protein